MYTTIGTCCVFQLTLCWFHLNPANRQSTERHNTYQLFYIYSIPPDDGLQICPKHVEVDLQNKLRINSASSWFLLHRCIEMYGQQNIKFNILPVTSSLTLSAPTCHVLPHTAVICTRVSTASHAGNTSNHGR